MWKERTADSGQRTADSEQTEISKPVITVRNFANAPNKNR